MRHLLAFLIVLLTAHAGIAASAATQTQQHKPKPYQGLTTVCDKGQNPDGSFWIRCVG